MKGQKEKNKEPELPAELSRIDYEDLDASDAREAEEAANLGAWDKFKRILIPASKKDLRLYGRLLQYVRPYTYRVVIAVLLSVLGGTLVFAQLALIQKGLTVIDPSTPIVNPAGGGGFSSMKSLFSSGDETDAKDSIKKAAEAASPTTAAVPALSKEEASDRRNLLGQVVILFMGVILLGALFKFTQTMMMTVVSRKVIRQLRDDCFKVVVRLPLRFHENTAAGGLIARIMKDINRLRELLISFAITGSKEICVFFGALTFALMQTSYAALFAAIFVLVAIVPIRVVADKLRHRDKGAEAAASGVFSVLTNSLAGQKAVKTFSAEKHETKRFKAANKFAYKKMIATYRLRALTDPLVDIVGGVGIALAIYFLGGWVIDGMLNIGELAAVVLALQKLSGSVRKMGKLQNSFVRGIVKAERVVKLLDQKPEVKEQKDAIPLETFKQEIKYQDVGFSHERDVPTLKKISVQINRGETVAFVGPSGSGKTSLVDLLPRLYDVDSGSIVLDGVDIRQYTLKSLRDNIITVSQETILFPDSIRDNIAYGIKNVDEQKLVDTAILANAHEFILEKPAGYDTVLSEGGVSLSGGERQRIAIARALLRNPPILILDEATSALDSEAEALVQDALRHLMKGRTTLVIAHRLSTVVHADRIVVLNRGEIVEQGTHDELLAKNGRYARAYQLQVKALARDKSAADISSFFDSLDSFDS